MNTNIIVAVALIGWTATSHPATGCGLPQQSLDTLAKQALSQDKSISSHAISQLRAKGPEGLDALLKANAVVLDQHQFQAQTIAPGKDDPLEWAQLKAALDTVGAQCDCYASRLYWYSDLNVAKFAAKASGKPILSLRLLGKLNEDYSCANSRFFRTTLYPNVEISKYLREHFILHWQSVRPVPKITIDFGDGRKIERTITGNSAHYVLDPDGELVDVLPGLYGPKAFLRQLQSAEELALAGTGLSPDQKRQQRLAYHARWRDATLKAWNADLARLGLAPTPLPMSSAAAGINSLPTARMAGELALSKRAIEAPLLKSTQPPREAPLPGRAEISEELWARVAALHSADARLDAPSFALISGKLPSAVQASRLAVTKSLVETPALRTLRNLQGTIAEDTVRNEYVLHQQIHQWFLDDALPADLDRANAKVYAELFLMPDSDPWLGLAPADVFTGLPNQGLVTTNHQ